MALSWSIAGGILLTLFAIRLSVGAVDWLDRRTSQITDDEARRRARLTMSGHWPPPVTPASYWRPVAWTWGIIALLLAGWSLLRGTWR